MFDQIAEPFQRSPQHDFCGPGKLTAFAEVKNFGKRVVNQTLMGLRPT
jgi:hypothetical protein